MHAAGDPAAVEAAALRRRRRGLRAVRAPGTRPGPARPARPSGSPATWPGCAGCPPPAGANSSRRCRACSPRARCSAAAGRSPPRSRRSSSATVRGRLAPGTPRSGLGPAVERCWPSCGCPAPVTPRAELRLDPLRSDLDRRREVALQRLTACRVPYAERVAGDGGAAASTRSPRAGGCVDARHRRDARRRRGPRCHPRPGGRGHAARTPPPRDATGRPDGGAGRRRPADAAECGLPALAAERLDEVAMAVPAPAARLAELDRRAGTARPAAPGAHRPALPEPDRTRPPRRGAPTRWRPPRSARSTGSPVPRRPPTRGRCSNSPSAPTASGSALRLADALAGWPRDGTPLIAAAAGAVGCCSATTPPTTLGVRVASWVDAAGTADRPARPARRLTGLLAVAEPLLQAASRRAGPAARSGRRAARRRLPDPAARAARRLPHPQPGRPGPAAGRSSTSASATDVGDLGERRRPGRAAAPAVADRAGRAA